LAKAQRNGLGPLVLVVWETQVLPAAVKIEALAEQVEAHHHALAVPARTTLSPRRRPSRLAGLGELPHHEVSRMALLAGADDFAVAATGTHVIERLEREQSIVVDGLHIHVHAVVGHVGLVERDDFADHLDHLIHVLRGARDVGRSLDVDPIHRLKPHCLALRGDVLPRTILTLRAVDDVVVDVGDVRHELHVEARPFKEAPKDVVAQRRAAVAEMGWPINGRATQVDTDLARLAKSQLTHGASRGVIQVQHDVECTRTHPSGPRRF
jgi:hypothetical protein